MLAPLTRSRATGMFRSLPQQHTMLNEPALEVSLLQKQPTSAPLHMGKYASSVCISLEIELFNKLNFDPLCHPLETFFVLSVKPNNWPCNTMLSVIRVREFFVSRKVILIFQMGLVLKDLQCFAIIVKTRHDNCNQHQDNNPHGTVFS